MSETKEKHMEVIECAEYIELRDDVERLRTELSMHVLERDELRLIICKNLEMEYMLKLGSLEYKAYETQCEALRLKRKIELIQAAKNRQENVKLNIIDKILDEEFLDYEKKLSNLVDKMNDALDRDRCGNLSKADSIELKKLYRKIVKALHPDINTNVTEAQIRLLNNAVYAYKNGDLTALRVIEEMVGAHEMPENHQDAIAKLKEEKERLTKIISSIQEEIGKIKSEYPYNVKDILNDNEKIQAKKDELEELLKQYKELADTYNAKLKEMLR